MKAVMLVLTLGLAMGCGNKEETTPHSQAEPPPTPAVSIPKQETPNPEPLATDKKPGTVLWESEDGWWVSSPAIGPDGTVYVGSKGDWYVYALNGKTGAKIWGFETGLNVNSSPAIGADGTVYIGSADNKLYALNGKSGKKLWEFQTGIGNSPAIGADGTVYIGSYDKKAYALNGKTGAKIWECEIGHEGISSPALGPDGILYLGSNFIVYAIRTSSKGLAKSPWPMFGQNSQHTGRAPKKE